MMNAKFLPVLFDEEKTLTTNKPLILVIDDSLVNLALLDEMLEKHNFFVVLANSGERGLDIAKHTPPDIILLDVMMPGWDGYETCRRIKQEPSLSKIPILFLSALGMTESKINAFRSGGVDYVSKPFQEEELLARVKTHVELAHLHKNLAQEVANQTAKIQSLLEALQLSYNKAQQASVLKTQFLRNLSHEFRTPMNIIMGMTEMLIEDEDLNEEQRKFAETVMTASNQLLETLNNMLSFAEHFSNELKQQIVEFPLSDLIKSVLKPFESRVHTKKVPIVTEIAYPLLNVSVKGNRDYLREVLTKLVDNALKFTEQGEIFIRVQQLEPVLEKFWIRFEVIDTGIGVAPEHQADLFNVFSQIDGSSTRSYQGMGMGLAIAKLFTENMGGYIGLESTVNQGSTFWFKVPLLIL